MSDDEANGVPMLPPELWLRILQDSKLSGPKDSKALCLVCRLFADICQSFLFKTLAVSANAAVGYKNPAFDSPGLPRWPVGANRWPKQEWEWGTWEKHIRSAILSERRLTLIGNHARLPAHTRSMKITGYDRYAGGRRAYPSNPFQAPSEKRMLSKAVFDTLQNFRQTLLNQLPAFTNLRKLELVKYPVDSEFVAALNSHPTLTDVQFDFCWYPESHTSLTSVTSISFGSIPGSHFRPIYMSSDDPHREVPDHHVASAFALIYCPRIQELQITFGGDESDVEPVFRQLCAAISEKGDLLCLRSLTWRFLSRGERSISLPIPLVLKVLRRMPALRKLDVQGFPPAFPIGQHVPPELLPLLETLSCPLEWAKALVPGRPVTDIRTYLRDKPRNAGSLASNGAELEDFFGPPTLSTAPVTTLHLPPHPPVTPASLFFPYLTAKLPALRDLRAAVAEDSVAALPIRWRCGTRSGPPLPYTDTTEEIVEEELINLLQNDLRGDVERVLNGGATARGEPGLPPVLDRIMAFRGIPEPPSDEVRVLPPRPPSAPIVMPMNSRDLDSSSSSELSQPSPTSELAESVEESPLERFDKYFGGRDIVPSSNPRTSLDVIYFLARGYYPLPANLVTLTLFSCFAKIPLGRYSRREAKDGSYSISREQWDYNICIQATLSQITDRFAELRAVGFSDPSNIGPVTLYSKKGNAWHRRSGYFWQLDE